MAGAGRMYVGCAGWSIPRLKGDRFPGEGSHLERYARRFNAVEINSSFYRPHLPRTYSRWAATVPEGFRFSVKVPREITHRRKLVNVEKELGAFIEQVESLGEKLGPLLVQLPPGLPFVPEVAQAFFGALRDLFPGDIVCEPRHPTWFGYEADRLLIRSRAARVAADPAVVPEAAGPGGWRGIVYYRLHGSPKMYYSSYDDGYLSRLAQALSGHAARGDAWCVFDNTAEYAALDNAFDMIDLVGKNSSSSE